MNLIFITKWSPGLVLNIGKGLNFVRKILQVIMYLTLPTESRDVVIWWRTTITFLIHLMFNYVVWPDI